MNTPKPASLSSTVPNPPEQASSTREISAMAWVEDHYGRVLLVKQAGGKRLRSLPGGKIRRGEALHNALRREVKEETGLIVDVASMIDYYDRPEKGSLTFLFRVILKPIVMGSKISFRPNREIESFEFCSTLPEESTPSLKYFWDRAQKTFDPLSILQSG